MSDRAQVGAQALAVVLVVAAAVYGLATGLSPAPPPVSSPIPTTAASPSTTPRAVAAPSPTPGPSAAGPAPTASPAPSPSASRRPIATTAYAYGGRSYTGVSLGAGWTVVAPFDGRVEVHVYQLVDGVIREFTDVAGVPSYPYVILTAADGRKVTYRPGAITADTQLLVRGSQAKAGDDLFAVIGNGPSSWHDFYDPSISFGIVISLVTAAGADADAASLVKAR